MGEAVSCCSKYVGDAGVNVGIVARVTAKISLHGVVAHNVWEVVSEHKHLRQTEGFILSDTFALEVCPCDYECAPV